jgi:putative heme-binding domain-containing protein
MPARLPALFFVLAWSSIAASQPPTALSKRLAAEPITELANAVRERGDAGRGAVLFFQPYLGCAKCHDGADGARLGPDLSRIGKDGTTQHLIESVLAPSKSIRKEYEPITVATADGRTVTGLLIDQKDGVLKLVDPAAGDKVVTIPTADVEARSVGVKSLMPEGLIDTLSDRQQFLDLCKYLVDIADGGPERARALRPAVAGVVIPEYENRLDHAGLIRSWNEKSYRRGEAIFERVCANCHGTLDRPGSLPTSPRFATHAFKNGADPHGLYRTLTHGYGQMAPQTWMAPRQKYDVIHYLREHYLKERNPAQYRGVDPSYLADLPKGNTFGPTPSTIDQWVAMDYGPSLNGTYEVGAPGPNFAYKGIAIRLDAGSGGVSRGRRWALFDHDTLRLAAAWTGEGFIDWNGIHFNGRHFAHPKLVGSIHYANPTGPGWANPQTGGFDDPRPRARDGRRYGPLPKAWAQYRGCFHYGDQTILSYTVGDASVLESAGAEVDPKTPDLVVFSRTFEIGKSSNDLLVRLAPQPIACTAVGSDRVKVIERDGDSLLRIPAAATPVRVKALTANVSPAALSAFAIDSPAPQALEPLTQGGPRRWPEALASTVIPGGDDGPFAADVVVPPDRNPWNAQLRLTGFDFLDGGRRMAVCSWDGDVWMVDGLDRPERGFTWRRIASGLFQPLGLKVRDGELFVCCRDQIVRLHDRNGDGETDYYECFNNDHLVTEHFHEFAMGLQTDAEGAFYYAKSARHALPAVVPHHGTLLKVSKDGSTTEILATGFRAANGVCVNPDGTFFVTDQEGHWTPKNRVNLVERGGFYGNLWSHTNVTDPSDAAMKQPLCWITNDFDRSPSELLWTPSKTWGPLAGSLLNFSYGYGKVYVVPHEVVGGQAQGGMCALPIANFPTGVMRGRFHPRDGHLYCCGMYAWAGSQVQPGGFYRIRATGKPMDLPVGLKATRSGLEIAFSDLLDRSSASDPGNYEIKVWGLRRTDDYGSPHVEEQRLSVASARLAQDGKSVRLEVPDLRPTRCMEIKLRLKGDDGRPVERVIHNTIHRMGE